MALAEAGQAHQAPWPLHAPVASSRNNGRPAFHDDDEDEEGGETEMEEGGMGATADKVVKGPRSPLPDPAWALSAHAASARPIALAFLRRQQLVLAARLALAHPTQVIAHTNTYILPSLSFNSQPLVID